MAVENYYRITDSSEYRLTDEGYLRITDDILLPDEPDNRLFVYFGNALKNTDLLDGQTVAQNYFISNLYHEYFKKGVLFTDTTAVITAAWDISKQQSIEHVIVADTNASQIKIELFQQGVKVSAIIAENNNYINVIKFDAPYEVTQMVLTLTGAENVYCGKVWCGMAIKFPRFLVKPTYTLGVNGKGSRTANGQAYGVEFPSLQKFDVSFERVSNIDRARMMLYIDQAQYIVPHFIEPYFMPDMPAMYVTLTDAGKFQKRKEPGFWWDTDMTWTESR